MASSSSNVGLCFATVFIIGITCFSVAAEEFKVGGDEGWKQPEPDESEMYSRWAEAKKFHIGDSLRFSYKNDSVMVVDKYGYYHCNSTRPTSVFKNGDTVIQLERPGAAYFVSGDGEHCKNGQRLMVEVIPSHGTRSSASPFPAGPKSLKLLLPQLLLVVTCGAFS